MNQLTLTNATGQDLIEGNHERFKVEFYDVIDSFKEKERRKYTVIDKTDNSKFQGIVEVNPLTKKVLSTKQFNKI
jgi:hypothetical protein